MITKRDLQRSAPFVHPKRGEPLRSGLRRGAFTSSKRDIPARLRRRPNDFLAAPPASPTAPQAPFAQWLTPLRCVGDDSKRSRRGSSQVHRIGTRASRAAVRARRARVDAAAVAGGAAVSAALG